MQSNVASRMHYTSSARESGFFGSSGISLRQAAPANDVRDLLEKLLIGYLEALLFRHANHGIASHLSSWLESYFGVMSRLFQA